MNFFSLPLFHRLLNLAFVKLSVIPFLFSIGLLGVPLENDLLAITSAKIMEVKNNFPHIKNSSSLTFLKYKYCVNKSRDKSRGHFAKNLK